MKKGRWWLEGSKKVGLKKGRRWLERRVKVVGRKGEGGWKLGSKKIAGR